MTSLHTGTWTGVPRAQRRAFVRAGQPAFIAGGGGRAAYSALAFALDRSAIARLRPRA
jgi:hypothetical protein